MDTKYGLDTVQKKLSYEEQIGTFAFSQEEAITLFRGAIWLACPSLLRDSTRTEVCDESFVSKQPAGPIRHQRWATAKRQNKEFWTNLKVVPWS